jgi:hypothetical protein
MKAEKLSKRTKRTKRMAKRRKIEERIGLKVVAGFCTQKLWVEVVTPRVGLVAREFEENPRLRTGTRQ